LTSILTTGHGTGCLIGAALAPTLIAHFGRSRTLATCAFISVVLGPLVVNAPWRAAAVVAVVAYGVAMMCIFVSLMGATQRDAPAASRGRVLSLVVSLWGLLYGVATLGMGALGDQIGLRLSFTVWAVAVFAAYANMIWRHHDTWTLLDHNDPTPLRRLDSPRR
jgi:MFS family permease